MYRAAKHALYASTIVASLIGAGSAFAVEPGDFQPTLRGATIGLPLGAAPPPGIYGLLENMIGANDKGVGYNSASAGANGGRGLTVSAYVLIPGIVWSTGWNFLGANPVFAVIKPFYTVAGMYTNCLPLAVGVPSQPGCVGSEPIAFGSGSGAYFENVHNTIFSGALSWNLQNGLFASAGLVVQGPDGSTYDGTLNQDYWTISPTFAVAYLAKDWHLSANFQYDIHGNSKGHTGSYAAVQANVASAALPPAALVTSPGGCVGFNCPGIGYHSGDQLFIDWAAKYNYNKWQFGPVGYVKYQTTEDRPGSGWTCAGLAASPVYGTSGLTCGRTHDIALGAMLGYNLGAGNLEIWATDSIYSKDDFKGFSIFTRLTFQIWGAEPPPAASPLITKARK